MRGLVRQSCAPREEEDVVVAAKEEKSHLFKTGTSADGWSSLALRICLTTTLVEALK
jgi:hypothetical protein